TVWRRVGRGRCRHVPVVPQSVAIRRSAGYELLLIPALGLPGGPRPARRPVVALDVVEPPQDLRRRIRGVVGSEDSLLAQRQRLRAAAGLAVAGLLVPAALLLPQVLQARHLVEPEARFQHQRAADRDVARVLLARGGDRTERRWLGRGRGRLG